MGRVLFTKGDRDGLRSMARLVGSSEERHSHSIRTRRRLIASFLELLRESPEIPTAARGMLAALNSPRWRAAKMMKAL
jgi:hypothetical protein